MYYFWWGRRGNLTLITLGSERVNRTLNNLVQKFTVQREGLTWAVDTRPPPPPPPPGRLTFLSHPRQALVYTVRQRARQVAQNGRHGNGVARRRWSRQPEEKLEYVLGEGLQVANGTREQRVGRDGRQDQGGHRGASRRHVQGGHQGARLFHFVQQQQELQVHR